MSEQGPIPFNAGQMSGFDKLSGAPPLCQNFLPDAAGALRQWPGIRAWSDFGTAPANSPVIGIFPWRNWILFILQNRSVYAWEASGSILDLSYTLDGSGLPVFAYDQSRVVFTGGGMPGKWEGSGAASDLAPGQVSTDGAPLALTSIAYSAQRFIGNVTGNSGVLQWTAPGSGVHDTWPVVGPYYAEAEAAPDPVAFVASNSNEVFAFGTETTQVYAPDPTSAFSVAASIETGVASDTFGLASYSVIETEDGMCHWFDNNRRFVSSAGRSADVISEPGMTATLKNLTTVRDCWGANIMIGSHDLLVWCFPTEAKCYWYDKITKKWGERSTMDSNGNAQSWIAQSYSYWKERNMHLVGLSDGTIAELTFDAADDNGTAINAIVETGFQDRGSFVRKLCERVQLQFRRGGTAPPATAPVASLRYRNDLGAWKLAKTFSMGAAEYQPVVEVQNLGEYRQRQWRLEWSGGSDFLLAGVLETFLPGDN